MLSFNVYRNSLYMMIHRGFDDAEEVVKSLEKEPPNFYISGSQYHNIGYKFQNHLRPDLKEIEDRFLMSYSFENVLASKKVYVIFGTSNKAFLEILTDIITNSSRDDHSFNVSYCLILNKDFNVKYSSRIDEMGLKVNLRIHLDSSLNKPPFHSLGARYSLMTDVEVETLLKEAKLAKKQLKKISWNCPMIMYYDFPRGSVVRIHRTPNIGGSMMPGPLPPDYRLIV